jgi:hypothetical protein
VSIIRAWKDCEEMGLQHGAWRDFHIVTQFEVFDEGEGLVHGDVAVGFEKHHCRRETGLHVANDKFW